MKNFLNEFKQFASRGNVLDMAVGVVMANSFTAIVNSMVKDIIMPFVALLTGDVQFQDLKLVLKGSGETAITLNYGNFIQLVINFIIVAFSIFCVIKMINRFHKKEEVKKEEAKVVESEELKTLKEIAFLLKKNDVS